MNNIFLLLGVTIAFASINCLPTTTAPLGQAAITELCQNITAQPALAKIYYNELLAVLNQNQKVEQYFKETLAYLNNPNNKKELFAGVQNCTQFFVGLKAALLADYQADGISPQTAAQKFAQYVANVIANIQAAIRASHT